MAVLDKVKDIFEAELRILASVTVANVSRPSKTRSTFATERSFSVTVNVFLNAQSASPIPEIGVSGERLSN